MQPDDATPREREIEVLGRLATGALWFLRRVLWVAGAVGVCVGVWQIARHDVLVPQTGSFATLGFVWVCAGLTVLPPVDWLFGRGRWLALTIAVALWFLPSLLAGDEKYGFLLRMFATLAACATLFVWRTLWRLTTTARPVV